MKVKQSKFYFHFLFDKNITKKQVQSILTNPAHTHLESLIEIIYNLLENKYIKLTPSLKNTIKKYNIILKKFVKTTTKSLLIQKKILKKHFRLFYYIIRQSRKFILLALDQ